MAADLTAAGGGVELHHVLLAEALGKGVDDAQIPFPLAFPAAGVQFSECPIVRAGVQCLSQFPDIHLFSAPLGLFSGPLWPVYD